MMRYGIFSIRQATASRGSVSGSGDLLSSEPMKTNGLMNDLIRKERFLMGFVRDGPFAPVSRFDYSKCKNCSLYALLTATDRRPQKS